MIKIITGLRRCGKSFLLSELFHSYLNENGVDDDHIIEIALDDRMNIELRNPDKILSYIKSRITDTHGSSRIFGAFVKMREGRC